MFWRGLNGSDAHFLRHLGHQLHQPLRADRRDRERVERRFDLNDRADQIRVETVARRRFDDRAFIRLPWRDRCDASTHVVT